MIRVNLLPGSKREARRTAAPRSSIGGESSWLFLVLGTLVLHALILIGLYVMKNNELTKVTTTNKGIQSNIDAIKTQIQDHPRIKDRLKQFGEREDAINKLQAARVGPTAAVMEISHILTQGRGPSIESAKLDRLRRENPGSLPNLAWDTKRVWVTGYQENNRDVKIVGLARDGEDVSEFIKRLAISDFFGDVKLLPGSKQKDGTSQIEVVKFQVNVKARY
jgi:type IV pilus assembly protein PilN